MPRPWLRSAFNEVNRYFYMLWILLNCQHCSTKLKNRNSYYGYIITLHVFAQNNINILKIMKFTAFETSPNIIYFFCTHICNICNLTKKAFKSASKILSNFKRFAPWDVENFVLQPAANPSMSH